MKSNDPGSERAIRELKKQTAIMEDAQERRLREEEARTALVAEKIKRERLADEQAALFSDEVSQLEKMQMHGEEGVLIRGLLLLEDPLLARPGFTAGAKALMAQRTKDLTQMMGKFRETDAGKYSDTIKRRDLLKEELNRFLTGLKSLRLTVNEVGNSELKQTILEEIRSSFPDYGWLTQENIIEDDFRAIRKSFLENGRYDFPGTTAMTNDLLARFSDLAGTTIPRLTAEHRASVAAKREERKAQAKEEKRELLASTVRIGIILGVSTAIAYWITPDTTYFWRILIVLSIFTGIDLGYATFGGLTILLCPLLLMGATGFLRYSVRDVYHERFRTVVAVQLTREKENNLHVPAGSEIEIVALRTTSHIIPPFPIKTVTVKFHDGEGWVDWRPEDFSHPH